MTKSILTTVLALVCALAFAPARASELSVLLSGRYHDPVTAYSAGPALYLDCQTVGKLYGGQVYWYQVAGRIEMTLRGHKVTFFVNSDEAKADGKPVKLGAPVLLRADEAWIPVSWLQSTQFASWSGFDTSFTAKTQLLA